MRAHMHFMVIYCEVHCAAPELEEQLTWVAVSLILLHGIIYGLLSQAVLKLEGSHWQAVDE